MFETIANASASLIVHVVGAVLALISAILILSLVRLNKGATANRSWLLIGAGLVLAAAGCLGETFVDAGIFRSLPFGEIAGYTLILIGIIDYRRLIKRLSK